MLLPVRLPSPQSLRVAASIRRSSTALPDALETRISLVSSACRASAAVLPAARCPRGPARGKGPDHVLAPILWCGTRPRPGMLTASSQPSSQLAGRRAARARLARLVRRPSAGKSDEPHSRPDEYNLDWRNSALASRKRWSRPAMALILHFLLGIGNFTVHKAVLESHTRFWGRCRGFSTCWAGGSACSSNSRCCWARC